MRQDVDVGMKCVKYMLFTTNFLFALIGFLLISVGSTISSIYGDFELFMEQQYFSPAALLIAIGVIIFFVSIFGCFGAIKKSTCLVNTYGLLLAGILILEISVAATAYSMRANMHGYLKTHMVQSMRIYENETYARESWDYVQDRLECCGIDTAMDWQVIGKIPIPMSCEDPPYNAGCLDKLSYIVSECAGLLGTGGVCVALVQLLGVIFAFMLAKSIRRLKTAAEIQRQENQQFYAQLAHGFSEKACAPSTNNA